MEVGLFPELVLCFSTQSAEQDTNVNNISGGIFLFFQARLFTSSCSKCLVQIMQFWPATTLIRTKRIAIFRVTARKGKWSDN